MFISSAMMVVLTFGSPYSLHSRSASSRIRSRVRRGGLRSILIFGAQRRHPFPLSPCGRGGRGEGSQLAPSYLLQFRIPHPQKQTALSACAFRAVRWSEVVQAEAVLALLALRVVLALLAFLARSFGGLPESRDTWAVSSSTRLVSVATSLRVGTPSRVSARSTRSSKTPSSLSQVPLACFWNSPATFAKRPPKSLIR